MLEVYFGILVCLSGCPSGLEIVSKNSYYSLAKCEHDERLIAQAMFIKDGSKYGYRCKKVEYDPPKVDN